MKKMVILCGIVALIFAGHSVFAGSGPDRCTATARAARTSCLLGTNDEYWLNIGMCQNITDTRAARSCTAAAQATRTDEQNDCADQYTARLDACGELGPGAYDPVINPRDFVTVVDNPLFPLTPGTTYVYETRTADGVEHNVVEVTNRTRVILGVTCIEVHDTVSLNGEATEDTLDWYAQDVMGNVWYFGENSETLEGGRVVAVDGSWMAGVAGAKPGIVMEANPHVGDVYRQEFQLEEAEDMGKVLALDATATVPYGSFTGLLETGDFSPLEPDARENKFYAAGIGVVLEHDLQTGDRTELISISH